MASKDKTNNTFQVGLIFLSKKNSNSIKLGKTHASHEVCNKLYTNPGVFASFSTFTAPHAGIFTHIVPPP